MTSTSTNDWTGPKVIGFRDMAGFYTGQVEGLFEVVEQRRARHQGIALFLVMAESGVHVLRFHRQSQALTIARAGGGALKEDVAQQVRLDELEADYQFECGLAAIETIGALLLPGAGVALAFAQGAISWTRCGLAVERFRSAQQGVAAWADAAGGQIVETIVDVGDFALVARTAVKQGSRAIGRKNLPRYMTSDARMVAQARFLLYDMPQFVLSSANLIDRAARVYGSAELRAIVLRHTSVEAGSGLPLPRLDQILERFLLPKTIPIVPWRP